MAYEIMSQNVPNSIPKNHSGGVRNVKIVDKMSRYDAAHTYRFCPIYNIRPIINSYSHSF